jgi:hypothetical protein
MAILVAILHSDASCDASVFASSSCNMHAIIMIGVSPLSYISTAVSSIV